MRCTRSSTRVSKAISLTLFAAFLLALPYVAAAKDYVLTIGGGYSPMGNQISLEKNILFFQRLLAEKKPDIASHEIFFADGDSAGRDLQYADPEGVPKLNRLLAEILGSENYLDFAYRSHRIPEVHGASSKENIDRWFDEVGARMQPGDRLILYVTAHGGRSKTKKKPYDTTIYLWNNKYIKVSELVERLDKLPEGVSVVTVMVQCHAGGFAHLIFEQGDATKDVSPRDRCGFFATLHSRQAAGCTADIEEENYHEYSSFFWAALGGKTRTGEPIDMPDYNGDGRVSFEEGHGYTLITSDTIDIPIKTSGEMLRAVVKKIDKEKQKSAEWHSADSPYEKLLALATPTETAVVEALSNQLELKGSDRAKQSRDAAKAIAKRRSELAKSSRVKDRDLDKLRNGIAGHLKLEWPELANLLSPHATEVIADHPHELLTVIESDDDYPKFKKLREEIEQIEQERIDLERRWVKHQRLVRTLENVALAANLKKFGSPDAQRRYARVLSFERGSLDRVSAALPEASEPVEEAAEPVEDSTQAGE